MTHPYLVLLFCIALFAGMLLCFALGMRLGRRKDSAGEETVGGAAALDGAVFALLGLLLAFTFSGAASRFDTRKQFIVQESNDIGTAWLRIDLLPKADQPAMRDLFRRHLDARIEMNRKLPDIAAAQAELARAARLQGEIWKLAVESCEQKKDPAATTLVLSSLNTMIDMMSTHTLAAQTHPPFIIYAMLFLLALACSLLAGLGMSGGGGKCWLHVIAFIAAIALSVYVILDIEYPRMGLIRIDAVDQSLIDLRKSMN